MELIKLFGALAASAIMLTSCGQGGGYLSGPSSTERGEAGAINPARNVYVVCQEKNNNNTGVTTNITNNCNKNNSTVTGGEEEVAE